MTKSSKKVAKKEVKKKVKEPKVEVEEPKKIEPKRVLGIGIPYYYNSAESELRFKELMREISSQLDNLTKKVNSEVIIYIYEDGQISEWLDEYKRDNLIIIRDKENKGVSHARNVILDKLLDNVLYVTFIDSDDLISKEFIKVLHEYCADNTHEVIETIFLFQGQELPYDPKVKRSCVAGSAIKTNIIGKTRFDEDLQIGEDTKFMQDILDLSKHRKKHCVRAKYIYQLGVNPKSLTMRYKNKIIDKRREK